MRLLTWLVIGLCAMSSSALAQSHVVVLEFSGPRADQIRGDVVRLLDDRDVGLLELERANAVSAKLSVDLGDESGRLAVAREEEITAFVRGETEKQGKRLKLTLHVYSGHDGGEVGTAEMNARPAALGKRLSRKIGSELQTLLAQTRAPDPIAPEPKAEPVVEAEEIQADSDDAAEATESDTPASGKRPEGLVVGVYASLLSRSFTYKDAVLSLSTHKILLNLSPTLSTQLYPMAFVSDGVLAHLGLDIRFSYLLFATSARDGQSYKTRSLDLRLGLRGRLPLGDHQLGLGIAYGMQSTSFGKGDDGSEAGVPDVRYGHLRIAGDGRFLIAGLWLQPALALLVPLSLGQIASTNWFPHASGLGVDASLHLAIPLSSSFEVVLGGAFRQWGLSLNPEPSDSSVITLRRAAGGATDRYITADLGLVLRY